MQDGIDSRPVSRAFGTAALARRSTLDRALTLKSYLQLNSFVTILFLKPFLPALGAVLSKMLCSCRARAKRLRAVALLVALAAFAVAPVPARAGCGHGVTSSASRASVGSLSGLEALSQARAFSVEPVSAAPRRDQPCSGPTCSGKREVPHAPARTVSVTNEFWCDMIGVLRPLGPELTALKPAVIAVRPRHASNPPERPPRGARPATFS